MVRCGRQASGRKQNLLPKKGKGGKKGPPRVFPADRLGREEAGITSGGKQESSPWKKREVCPKFQKAFWEGTSCGGAGKAAD